MKRALIVFSGILLLCEAAYADISLTDRSSVIHALAHNATARMMPTMRQIDANLPTRKQLKAENKATQTAKHGRRIGALSLRPRALATGSVALIDAGGLKYFINTNITFSTSSSASAGDSEASYTIPVAATTSGGGTTMSTLNDAYDGYQTICVSLTGATGPCVTGNAAYTIYNKNGPATVDTSVPAVPVCTGRQYIFGTQNIGGVNVFRKVYVPTNDQYQRWMNFFTNTTGSPITLNMITGNNLGSDSNTLIVSSSSGDAAAQLTDTWVTTFQNYSGNKSSDPRLGHIMQGPGAATPLSIIHFADADDNPFWGYTITLNPGETKAILNFGVAMPSKAAAATQSARLVTLPSTATQCLSATELSEVTNFSVSADLTIAKTASSPSVTSGQAFSYTLTVTNNGPATATSVTVTDPLPAGVTFVSAPSTGGWTCGQAAGTVTCTMPTLAAGPAAPITINVTAGAPGGVSNTATVSAASSDANPANNSANATVFITAISDLSIFKTTTTTTAFGGQPITYTINVSNAGPNAAPNVSVTDPLPPGAVFVSASGAGWTCSNVAGTVACTIPSLAVGPGAPITLIMNAPPASSPSTLVNTAAIASTAVPPPGPAPATDPNAANNASTSSVPLQPASSIPMFSPWMLLLLVATLTAIGWVALGRRF